MLSGSTSCVSCGCSLNLCLAWNHKSRVDPVYPAVHLASVCLQVVELEVKDQVIGKNTVETGLKAAAPS